MGVLPTLLGLVILVVVVVAAILYGIYGPKKKESPDGDKLKETVNGAKKGGGENA